MLISAPMVTTPVPPTPVTSRSNGLSRAGRAGDGQRRGSACASKPDVVLRPARGALHGDEARAEALEAGEVLVAGGQVDLALAAERRLLRLDAQAVGGDRAIAAAFADEVVDIGEALGVLHLPALAAAALLGGAGLLVDQHRDAGDLAQLLLHGIEILARVDRHALRADRRARTSPDRSDTSAMRDTPSARTLWAMAWTLTGPSTGWPPVMATASLNRIL